MIIDHIGEDDSVPDGENRRSVPCDTLGRPGGAIRTSGAQLPQVDTTELIAARTRRRVMRRLMPFLLAAYSFAYIDRANLGIAKLEMQRDLGFAESTIFSAF